MFPMTVLVMITYVVCRPLLLQAQGKMKLSSVKSRAS